MNCAKCGRRCLSGIDHFGQRHDFCPKCQAVVSTETEPAEPASASRIVVMWEETMDEYGIETPEREYIFFPGRKWRFDYAWPNNKIAVEADGQVHRISGRWTRDVEKHNAAQMTGWTVYRVIDRKTCRQVAENLTSQLKKR